MRRKIWKKLLAAGCAVSLLTTALEMTVLADQPQEGAALVTKAEDPEPEVEADETFVEEGLNEKYGPAEEVDISPVADDEKVGTGDFVVGDGVTATFEEKTGAVELYSNGGTLWNDWQEKSGLTKKTIKSLKVVSGPVLLPADSSNIFSVKHYNHYHDDNNDYDRYDYPLEELSLSGFDTSNVTNMAEMFNNCDNLIDLDISGIDTSKVQNMSGMFAGCRKISSLDLSEFNTSSVTDMSGMFSACLSLTQLNLSNFDTSKVTSMDGMFIYCEKLKNLNLNSFDTSNVASMCDMFLGCSEITELNLNNFKTTRVTDMRGMFSSCSNLKKLQIDKFDTSNLTELNSMFEGCESLEKLDLSSFDTSNVNIMYQMFYGCNALTELNLSSFNTSKVENMVRMFLGCQNLKRLDLSTFDTSAVIHMDAMFSGCSNLEKLDLGNFNTSNLWSMSYLFSGCNHLAYIDLSGFDMSGVGYVNDAIFDGCEDLSVLITPKNNGLTIKLNSVMYDEFGNEYTELPKMSKSIVLTKDNPLERTDIADCIITIDLEKFTYDGKAKEPTVTVKNGSATLTSGTDYSVNYVDNTNAGTATVKVTGIGNYKGEKPVTFTIEKAAPKLTFASSSVNKTTLDAAFTNKLTKTTDGTMTFKSSNTKVATVSSTSGKVTIKGEGTATITATVGEGTNYKSGSAKYTLTVVDGRTDVSGLTVSLSATKYTYDGKAKEPTVTVKNGNATLTSGTDYIVSYEDNTDAGTATVKVTGSGNYKGEKTVTFTISKANAKLAFADSALTKKTTDAAFTNTLTKTTDGSVTFKSSNTKVATVNSTSGLVTIKGAGKATITATAAEGKNYKAGSATYSLTVEAPAPTPTPAVKGFSDVQDPNHAFYKAIYWAADAGITKGYPDGTFGIDRSCTRGEMIMFLWRYAGKPAAKALSKSPFKDVPKTHAFYNAIIWASQKGITKGYPDGTFGINRNVSRGECMMFLWRLRGKPAPKAVSVSPFKDVPKTHAFYNAILWGAQKKITNGYTSGPKKGTFGINENCTRGAIVTFLYRAR